jgi:pullulanase
VLRSKSLDRNSFNSGDWFNRLDWTYRDNYFGTGLPPAEDNGKDYALLKPLLGNAAFKPSPADIAFARDAFRDLLAIRASSTLFRLPVRRRSSAACASSTPARPRTRPSSPPTWMAKAIPDAKDSRGISYFINVDKVGHTVSDPQAAGKTMRLHPVFLAPARRTSARRRRASIRRPGRSAFRRGRRWCLSKIDVGWAACPRGAKH